MSQAKQEGGVILISVLLDAALFGLVSQQVYGYFTSRFKDPMYLRLFVIVEFLLVGLQCLFMWHFVYRILVMFNISPPSTPVDLWEGPVNSICQLIIIMFANVFLAVRIETLTKSRVQSGFVVVLSVIAFVVGMFNTVTSWQRNCTLRTAWITSVIWHTVQAVAESLITLFLVRELLKNRIGIRRSDTLINYLVRTTIQTGGLATAWAIGGLVTWFFLPRIQIFRLFDITSGSIYTHAVFETLLARVKLREQMSGTTQEGGWTTQDAQRRSSRVSGRPHSLRFFKSDTVALQTLPEGKLVPNEL